MQPQYHENYQNRGGGNQPHSSGSGAAMFFISLMLVIATGVGVYFWQSTQANSNNEELLARIEELEDGGNSSASGASVNSFTSSGDRVAYKSQVGRLELSLSKNYAVVVRADGQFGDSERTILRVSEKMADGIYRDVLDDYVEIEITPSKKAEKEELLEYQRTLEKSGYTLDKQYEADFGNQKGYLVTGKSTFAQVRVYFIKSEGHAYKFAQTMPLDDPNEDKSTLLAVLNGMKLNGSSASASSESAPQQLKVQ